jgi:hypothetical protein
VAQGVGPEFKLQSTKNPKSYLSPPLSIMSLFCVHHSPQHPWMDQLCVCLQFACLCLAFPMRLLTPVLYAQYWNTEGHLVNIFGHACMNNSPSVQKQNETKQVDQGHIYSPLLTRAECPQEQSRGEGGGPVRWVRAGMSSVAQGL